MYSIHDALVKRSATIQTNEFLKDKVFKLQVKHAGSWFIHFGYEGNASVLTGYTPQTDGMSQHATITTNRNALETLLSNPETIWEFVHNADFGTDRPLLWAILFEGCYPGVIKSTLEKKLLTTEFTVKETTVSFFNKILPTLISAPGFMKNVKATYNFIIKGAGEWSLDTSKTPVVLKAGILEHAKCRVQSSQENFDSFLKNPLNAIQFLVTRKIEVSNECRARQLVFALWPHEIRSALPEATYLDIFTSNDCTVSARGEVFHTYVRYGPDKLHKIFFTDVNGDGIMEGDIYLGRTQDLLRVSRAVENDVSAGLEGVRIIDWGNPGKYVWPNRTIHYVKSSDLKEPERVDDAIAFFSKTNVVFAEGSSVNYVEIINGDDNCSSSVGMQGEKQEIKLTEGCNAGGIAHEFCHALGLWHEQSRYDRDDYVTINTDNIEPDYVHNFDKMLPSVDSYNTLGNVLSYIGFPPPITNNGDRYLIHSPGVNDWARHDNQIAEWESASNYWKFIAAAKNDIVRVLNASSFSEANAAYAFDGANWTKTTTSAWDIGDYDYGSIMHYGSRDFGKKETTCKKKVTIVTKGDESIGQRSKLSDGDIAALNTIYPL